MLKISFQDQIIALPGPPGPPGPQGIMVNKKYQSLFILFSDTISKVQYTKLITPSFNLICSQGLHGMPGQKVHLYLQFEMKTGKIILKDSCNWLCVFYLRESLVIQLKERKGMLEKKDHKGHG